MGLGEGQGGAWRGGAAAIPGQAAVRQGLEDAFLLEAERLAAVRDEERARRQRVWGTVGEPVAAIDDQGGGHWSPPACGGSGVIPSS